MSISGPNISTLYYHKDMNLINIFDKCIAAHRKHNKQKPLKRKLNNTCTFEVTENIPIGVYTVEIRYEMKGYNQVFKTVELHVVPEIKE